MQRRTFLASILAFFAPVVEAPRAAYRHIAGRYLFKIAAAPVPPDLRVSLRGLRQVDVKIEGPGALVFWPSVEQPLSPSWTFPSGNIAWYLRGR